ncbi:MAG: hypothetical protein QM831_17925 [Kofleriaceae bacterium]
MKVGLLLLASCSYDAGSFHSLTSTFPGERVTVGCLDLALDRPHEPEAQGPVVHYSFGNRCDHPVTVDFQSLVVRARNRAITPFDPNHEIAPKTLETRAFGSEEIEYTALPGDQLCIDVGSLIAEPTRWVCV